jgi:hypothetical protein
MPMVAAGEKFPPPSNARIRTVYTPGIVNANSSLVALVRLSTPLTATSYPATVMSSLDASQEAAR